MSFLIDDLSRAGTETQLLALLRTLHRDRVQPTLVLLNGSGEESKALEPADCPVLRLGVTKLFGRRAWRAARTLARFWQEERPDIVQAYFLDSVYFAAAVARWCGIRTVIRVRNNLGYYLTRRHRVLDRIMRPWIRMVLTNTEAARNQLIQIERLSPRQVHVIENGVDLERFPLADFAPPLSRAELTIGVVANLRPVKNIDGFLRAAVPVARRFPTAQIHIAGDGPERAALEALSQSLGMADRVHFHGSLVDVPGFLQGVDVAVLPSHSEGMSNALLEYMAAGRAIVATNVGANRRLITSGEQGLIVPPNAEMAMSAALQQLLSDPELSRRMGQAARRRVELEFSRDAMRRRFEEFYLRLAGRSEDRDFPSTLS